MTTAELFDKICSILVEKGKMPDILDYGLAADSPVSITNYEYDLKSNLAFGGSEGIYLDLWMVHYVGGERRIDDIGTFKTLREDHEAMHRMAALLADFILEETDYVNANLDDFNWEGADVYPADESGKRRGGGYSCGTMEAALKTKDEMLKKYPTVIVRDNATRKEKIYENGG